MRSFDIEWLIISKIVLINLHPFLNLSPAEVVGYTKTIPAFLDPNLKSADLPRGVSFASAASGYDDLTANFSVNS